MKTLFFILFTPLFIQLLAQPATNRPINIDTDNFECHYFGYKNINTPKDICKFLSFRSNGHAEEVVDNILKQVGLSRNFIVVECPNTENCFAAVVEGQRYIVYDGNFMKRVEDLTNTDWSAISIIAHEIGHHLQGHTIDGRGSRPEKELEADKFSGFVMHRLGATLEEASVAIVALGDDRATPTHPAKATRINAIRKGWHEAETLSKSAARQASTANSPKTVIKYEPEEEEEEDKALGCVAGDCENGIGVYVTETKERYQGPFRFGKRQGQGVQYYPDGSMRYKGDFKDDNRSGYGAYYFSNGDKYVGLFSNNRPNGKGTYYYADGDVFVGIYQDGKRNGSGTYYHKNGKKIRGEYEDDELVK